MAPNDADTPLNEIRTAVRRLDDRSDALNARLHTTNARLEAMGSRVEAVDGRVKAVDDRVKAMTVKDEQHVEELGQRVRQIQTTLYGLSEELASLVRWVRLSSNPGGDVPKPPAPPREEKIDPLEAGVNLAQMLERFERQVIESALERFDNNRERVAKELGVARSTLFKRLKEWGITRSYETE
ncbi:MAG: helix-turn-helix domain-containing protein [Myxococcota bacterium]